MSRGNPIGTGTDNVCCNMPKELAELLARKAFEWDLPSRGALIRHLLEMGLALKCRHTALEWRAIRQRYYGAVCLMLFLGIYAHSILAGGDDFRRARRNGNGRVHVSRVTVNRGGRRVEWDAPLEVVAA